MRYKSSILAAIAAAPLLLAGASSAQPEAPVDLGTAENFAILSKAGVSSTGATQVAGDVGVSPIDASGVTGFALVLDGSGTFATSSKVIGKVYAADYSNPTPAYLTTAVSDMETAYSDAAGRTPDVSELGAGGIGGLVITPGVYRWGTAVTIDTDVTLSGGPAAVWIFQISGTLDTASATKVILSGGAQADNIFWQVTGQTTLGTTSEFSGIILGQTGIAMNTGATLDGRAFAQTAVTLDGGGGGGGVGSLCPASPEIDCNTAARSVFKLKDKSPDGKDKFLWKFQKATNAIDKATQLGDPVAGATSYTVCVWDRTGGVASLVSTMLTDAGGSCGARPCWKETALGAGVRYKNKDANASGVVSVAGKSGIAGKGRLVVKGAGAKLLMPAPLSATEIFDQDTEVVVQMRALDSGACWESVFGTGTARKNTGTLFKAVTP
jgi:ice-binding like protein